MAASRPQGLLRPFRVDAPTSLGVDMACAAVVHMICGPLCQFLNFYELSALLIIPLLEPSEMFACRSAALPLTSDL